MCTIHGLWYGSIYYYYYYYYYITIIIIIIIIIVPITPTLNFLHATKAASYKYVFYHWRRHPSPHTPHFFPRSQYIGRCKDCYRIIRVLFSSSLSALSWTFKTPLIKYCTHLVALILFRKLSSVFWPCLRTVGQWLCEQTWELLRMIFSTL